MKLFTTIKKVVSSFIEKLRTLFHRNKSDENACSNETIKPDTEINTTTDENNETEVADDPIISNENNETVDASHETCETYETEVIDDAVDIEVNSVPEEPECSDSVTPNEIEPEPECANDDNPADLSDDDKALLDRIEVRDHKKARYILDFHRQVEAGPINDVDDFRIVFRKMSELLEFGHYIEDTEFDNATHKWVKYYRIKNAGPILDERVHTYMFTGKWHEIERLTKLLNLTEMYVIFNKDGKPVYSDDTDTWTKFCEDFDNRKYRKEKNQAA